MKLSAKMVLMGLILKCSIKKILKTEYFRVYLCSLINIDINPRKEREFVKNGRREKS